MVNVGCEHPWANHSLKNFTAPLLERNSKTTRGQKESLMWLACAGDFSPVFDFCDDLGNNLGRIITKRWIIRNYPMIWGELSETEAILKFIRDIHSETLQTICTLVCPCSFPLKSRCVQLISNSSMFNPSVANRNGEQHLEARTHDSRWKNMKAAGSRFWDWAMTGSFRTFPPLLGGCGVISVQCQHRKPR